MKGLIISLCAVLFSVVGYGQIVSVNFVDLDGMSFDKITSTLTKTASSGWINNSAFSENMLEAGTSGSIEYTIENSSDTKAFGISSNTADRNGLNSVDYGFYVSRGSLYVLSSGKVKMSLGRIRAGTRLKIAVSLGASSKVDLFLNGRAVFGDSLSNVDYHVGAIISNQGGTFVAIKTDFPLPAPPPEPLISTQYTELTELPTAFVKKVEDEFCFSFNYRKTGDSDQMMFAVYNLKHIDKSANVSVPDLSLRNGVNQFCMDVGNISEGIYTLEVTLPNGDKLYSKFENGIGTIDQSNSGPK